ncbi:hypothetical protein PsorP6_014125 [Peronosclerospora sorghi]|uniref:Uncharacterized protein n=1 Tax=Peronosclerospora sorghi TaxID=230839 RepID=A0ACC0VIB8_9STRA|nr:hypothetical protein PsorP6_014125 [Peronosclerospora sorghi]
MTHLTETGRHSKRRSKSPYRAKRALFVPSPSPAVSLSRPSLSPASTKGSTDHTLTFLQSARDRNVPVRFGKWSREEDAYLEKLITLFQDGVLAGIEAKTSLRSWLAQMLICCPMRISKKQMSGHQFEGKAKYKRNAHNSEHMTQQQYDAVCNDVWHLRAEFLKAWAKDEYAKRSTRIRAKDTTFKDWYNKVLNLVPVPRIAKRFNLVEFKTKRKIETIDELKREIQDEAKRQKVQMLVEIRATKVQEEQTTKTRPPEPLEIAPLEPVPASLSFSTLISTPPTSRMRALSTYFSAENWMMNDWLIDFEDREGLVPWTDSQKVSQPLTEPQYTSSEDQVQISVQLHDQHKTPPELAMARASSKFFADFGAPSCWNAGEEFKRTPSLEYSHWTDNDLTEDLSISLEPGIFGWSDSSPIAPATCSPTLKFL